MLIKFRNQALLAISASLLTTSPVAFSASAPAVEAKQGMVVSAQALASQVGVEILRKGGNAVDAAVAVGYAKAVVYPCCGNIGGGGFMTIRLANGEEHFFNFREQAPAAASADMYLDSNGNVIKNASLSGYKAVATPGTVLGLDTVLKRFGRLTRAQVMAPAIKLARQGFILTRADTDVLDTKTKAFKNDPEMAKVFLRSNGDALQPGDRLVQKDLANTLELISKQGPDAFYSGKIPMAIEQAAAKAGGIIKAKDFASYTVTEETPITCTYRGYEILSAPPPSSGGVTLCQILNILEGYDLKSSGFNSAKTVHYMVEAMRQAYLDRNSSLGDPAFIKNPLDKMLSKDYAAEVRSKIEPSKAGVSDKLTSPLSQNEKPETTHYSVVDKAGNAVSTTYTVNGRFGAVVMAPGTGVILNNEMDDFTVKIGEKNLFGLVQGVSNAIAPKKRPLSSMAPTIVKRDGKTVMVLGSPGGSRIITITLQTMLNVIDFGMKPQEAVNAPRIHHQWQPDVVYFEAGGLSMDTLNILREMGYKLQEVTGSGAAELIFIPVTNTLSKEAQSSGSDSAVSGKIRPGFLYGAHDVRQPSGAAFGY